MTERSNKRLIERYFQTWSEGKLDDLEEILADDFQYNDPAHGAGDRESYLAFSKEFRTAFPDLKVDIKEMHADKDDVTVYFRAEGTQKNEFMGAPPKDRHFAVDGLALVHIEDGKVQRDFTAVDMLDVMQQLGAMPEQAASPT